MIINEVLKSLKGESLVKRENVCPNCKCAFGQRSDITVQDTFLAAVMNAPCKPNDKVERFKLCQKIANNSTWEFDGEEIELLEQCIKEESPPIIFGRLMEILDV